ncbi:MAG: hypothetical protein LWY06_08275 [Firmicutes bacterium]|nr:hypothetical protein [Bacillota bacterium]
MPLSQEEAGRLGEFLSTVKRMKESALIFSSPAGKSSVMKEIKSCFPDVKHTAIDQNIPEKEDIDKAIISSLKEGTLLVVSLYKNTNPAVLRRLEQIMEDGHIPVQVSNEWRKVEPVDTWKTIIWINRDDYREDEFPLRRLFVNKIVLE